MDTHLWSRSQSLHRASIDSAFLARASKPQRKTSSKQKRLQLFKTMSLDLVRWCRFPSSRDVKPVNMCGGFLTLHAGQSSTSSYRLQQPDSRRPGCRSAAPA